MKKKLSEACSNVEDSITVIQDCEFDQLYLVGKLYDERKSLVSFVADGKYVDQFLKYDISGVICTAEVAELLQDRYDGGIAIADHPKTVFWKIHNYYAGQETVGRKTMVSDTAVIHRLASIDDNNVVIGDNTIIAANAVIKEGTVIGDNCIVREGCVIGSPAFYYYGEDDQKELVISTGSVEIGNNVELHTNVTVEKGVMGGVTRIGDNTKIDNVSLVEHDSKVGKNVTICAGTILAGGVEIGEESFLGAGVTVAPNVKCGSNVKLSAGAVATKDVPDGVHVSGNFAVPHDRYVKHVKEISGTND